jgi:hypothetical protein
LSCIPSATNIENFDSYSMVFPMFAEKLLKNLKVYNYLRIDKYNMENFSGGHGCFPVNL